jgi:alkylation response protein AidB-like acyl-CoA dehydrogenase
MGSVLQPDDTDPGEAVDLGRQVGRRAAPYAAEHDREASFVTEGYEAVRELGYGSLAVPKELGGMGHGLLGVCRGQAAIGRRCANTSLAIAMHQHAVLTMAWRWQQGDVEVERILRQVVGDGLILSASGTLSPAMITLEATPCEGGYVVNGQRRLCSGSPGSDGLVAAANLVVASQRRPISVVVPLQADGVEVVDDWDSMGMRGSGSNSVRFEDAFVPAENALYVEQSRQLPGLSARRGPQAAGGDAGPQGIFMPGLHISLAVIAATYLGAATGVRDAALREVAGTPRAKSVPTMRLAGLMAHEVRVGWWALEGMVRQTTDESIGSTEQMVTTMLGKRQIILGSIRAAELAMEVLGSRSYMKDKVFERTLRDVRAGVTHPLPPEHTLLEVGRSVLATAATRRQSATD